MANIIFDSRLESLKKEFGPEYKWHLMDNGITENDLSFEDFLMECAGDETKLMMHTLRIACPRVLAIFKKDGKSWFKILGSRCLNEVMETIKGKAAALFTDMADFKATIYHEDGTETNITYRYIKENDPVVLNRLLGKVERSEQYSSADLSRCSTTIKPEIMRIYEVSEKKNEFGFSENFDFSYDFE